MIDAATLLADTRRTVSDLVDDLRQVAGSDPAARAHVADEYQRAHAAGRTAYGQAEWAEGLFAQVAVAWTLGCVFVRFCEDNGLVAEPLLGGPALRAQLALDQRAAHLHANSAHDDRHWLREVFSRLRALPATGEVFGAHNPIWLDGLLPSADGARRLREDLTRIDPDSGRLRHDFTDPEWDTRFLGDLYQDLSDHAKKTYALLQTPVFVEEFILDRTLDPAIATFGLTDTTIIDPTCGSGHFLLGAFDRLLHRWIEKEPATNPRVLAQRALDAVAGIDLNPFAASIARFRLLLAALRSGGDARLVDAPAYNINVAVGDSLLHGDPPGALPGMQVPGEEEALLARHGYASEDHDETRSLLGRQWAAVVGNPPYIVVRDAAVNAAYRNRFMTCHRQYSLGVPFTERFWQLARVDADPDRAGFIGLITADTFMKREFGKKLIETWFPSRDLTHLIDTRFAEIPGHNQTVILFGRNRAPKSTSVRAVLGIRGEAARPGVPYEGLVWSEIVALIDQPGEESTYISIVDLERDRLRSHPWSIGGGGASELKELLDRGRLRLGDFVSDLGRTAHTGEDDAYLMPRHCARRLRARAVQLVNGEDVRDWTVAAANWTLFPYDSQGDCVSPAPESVERHYWMLRTLLRRRLNFGQTNEERGLTWWEYSMFFPGRYGTALSITFAEVATHNHFALDRGDKVFKQTAPVIKLERGAGEERHLGLLAILNSSTACFWMKEVCYRKSSSHGGGSSDQPFTHQFAFDAAKLKQLPLPAAHPTALAAELDGLAVSLALVSPAAVASSSVPSSGAMAASFADYRRIRSTMIAVQEGLDWQCYRLYDLAGEEVAGADEPEPPLEAGQRAFEILLARRIAAGEEASSWFARHEVAPITELPQHWSSSYRALVERRIELIEADLNIGLLERPEHKRRWASEPWEERVSNAVRNWLLDRLEERRYWHELAAITTVARLASDARADEDFMAVARLYAGRDDVDVASLIGELAMGQAVAYLAPYRYTDSGLRTHGQWLATWELQRREDAGEDVGSVAPPPKYVKADFTGPGWILRGKLDVPKERFISYPGAERETDASAVVGWAGWDHLERARALAAWYLQAKRDGRAKDHLTPQLAGLAELVPWLKQWYDEPNSDPSRDRPGSQVAALVDTELRSLGLTHDDLAAWRPPAPAKRGRPRKASS